jgi:hypothetical protein
MDGFGNMTELVGKLGDSRELKIHECAFAPYLSKDVEQILLI